MVHMFPITQIQPVTNVFWKPSRNNPDDNICEFSIDFGAKPVQLFGHAESFLNLVSNAHLEDNHTHKVHIQDNSNVLQLALLAMNYFHFV